MTGQDALWITITMISSEKMLFFAAVRGNIGACETKETLGYIFFIYLFILWQCIQISVNC